MPEGVPIGVPIGVDPPGVAYY